MKAFSFIHAADLHLGYLQYGLEARREDFDRAFEELVNKSIELKPDFVILAGDIFHQPRPSNVTLENAVRSLGRLREAGIQVLTVDGSHDSAPNNVTGTILNPLDSAGLINYLPRHDGACWRKSDCCYVYGVPNCRTRHKTEETLPEFYERNEPIPESSVFNIFIFHMALDLPGVKPSYIEAEATPAMIPDGFDYYAAGHLHRPSMDKFKTGTLAYSGCTETTDYSEADIEKGFYHISVDEKKNFTAKLLRLESVRKFAVIDEDFTGTSPSKITERSVQMVKAVDADGVVIVPVLKGTLPVEASRAEVDLTRIRAAAERALFVHPVVQLRESEVSDEVVRSIFESQFTDLRTKAFEYFNQIFSERYGSEDGQKIAHVAVALIDPLTKKQEDRVRETIEGLLR